MNTLPFTAARPELFFQDNFQATLIEAEITKSLQPLVGQGCDVGSEPPETFWNELIARQYKAFTASHNGCPFGGDVLVMGDAQPSVIAAPMPESETFGT